MDMNEDKGKVLAVDDDERMCLFYEALFLDAGYEVRTAADAAAALDLYHEFGPDFLVLDAEIPAGGGEKVFETLRKVLLTGTPVIFVTGLPDRVSYFALTGQDVRIFRKPVGGEELLECAAGMLETIRKRRAKK